MLQCLSKLDIFDKYVISWIIAFNCSRVSFHKLFDLSKRMYIVTRWIFLGNFEIWSIRQNIDIFKIAIAIWKTIPIKLLVWNVQQILNLKLMSWSLLLWFIKWECYLWDIIHFNTQKPYVYFVFLCIEQIS